MAGITKKLLNVSIIALTIPMMSFAAQKDNPRGSAVARNVDNNAVMRDSATSVIAKSVTSNTRQTRSAVEKRPVATSQATKTRSATNTAARTARSTTTRSNAIVDNTGANKSRSATVARATRGTPLFTDVSKMGSGYTACRDAYATCMDQICGYANETYRRCICNDKFMSFRDTSDKLDSAVALLAQFQDNNLEAVDKTAAEVSAMYSASEGESKIKKDTSASQKLLNNVTSLLAGKTIEKKQNNLNSLGVLDLSAFNTNTDDIWEGGSTSIFGGDSYESLDDLEGKELFNRAHKQCEELVRNSCGSDATYNLARSAYSIMITQDCNLYETSINAKRVQLEDTVRTAQKYLREARLEEYRAHNSADVLQCLENVETAMRKPVACGENYEKCMDYTGRYVDVNTGEPIFRPEFFGLNSLIILDGGSDVLKTNPAFDKWLDEHRTYATTALDSCRDISENVWREFKRSAIIQMAQSQDAMIEKVKNTCLNVIKDCYDEKTDTLNDIDTTSGQYLGGLAAWSARGACYEKVLSCAALYGDPSGCKYDDKTKKITTVSGKKCGLQSLLTYVDTIDAVKVAEGCEAGLRKRAHELCDPRDTILDAETLKKCVTETSSRVALKDKLDAYKAKFCPEDAYQGDDSNPLSAKSVFNDTALVDRVVDELYEELGLAFMRACEDDTAINGEWVDEQPSVDDLSREFYKKYFAKSSSSISSMSASQIAQLGANNVGWCIMGAEQRACLAMGSDAEWVVEDGEAGCALTTAWYRNKCQRDLNGRWTGSYCIVDNVQYTMDEVYNY